VLTDCEQKEIARHLEKLQWYLDRVKNSLDKLEEDVDRNSDAAGRLSRSIKCSKMVNGKKLQGI